MILKPITFYLVCYLLLFFVFLFFKYNAIDVPSLEPLTLFLILIPENILITISNGKINLNTIKSVNNAFLSKTIKEDTSFMLIIYVGGKLKIQINASETLFDKYQVYQITMGWNWVFWESDFLQQLNLLL